MDYFCGVIAILGESNAGKSHLLNTFLETPLAEVHHKRNLTRECMRAVITQDNRQLVLEDTAGLAYMKSSNKSASNKSSSNKSVSKKTVSRNWRDETIYAAQLADILLWVIDAARVVPALESTLALAEQVAGSKFTPDKSFVALNKVDLLRDKSKLLPLAKQLAESQRFSNIFMLSARKGLGIEQARSHLFQSLPIAPFLYKRDGDTRTAETIACEITRTFLYDRLHAELPYDSQVENELVERQEDGGLVIAQRLRLRRESQRRILLAHQGRLLNTIKRLAQQALEKRFGCSVQLALHLPKAKNL